MARRFWDRQELLEALRLYCLTPFGRIHSRNPDIIALANDLDRSANAVALKMVNFASLDPTIDRKGMSNVSDLDRKVWDEFFGNLLNIQSTPENLSHGFSETQSQFDVDLLPGLERPVTVNRRINQDFFRKLVLASYNFKCAATGISEPQLLVAGHIVPWSVDNSLRTNPANGICLNNLFDKAFDRRLIAIGEDWKIIYSSKLPSETVRKMKSIAFEKIQLPEKFRPDPALFESHRVQFVA